MLLLSCSELRTVSTIVIAHMFCESRDTRISYGCNLDPRALLLTEREKSSGEP